MSRSSVGVLGGGTWGVALAAAAARTGAPTWLLTRRGRPGTGDWPAGVEAARDAADVAARARVLILAVPSAVAREVARSLGPHVDGRHFIVHGVRGLVSLDPGAAAEAGGAAAAELETIADVVRDETPARRLGALGGPALASDLLAGRPSVLVCGSRYPEVAAALRDAFAGPNLRLYATEDLLGLEWASALVGCLAIGVGYARGLGLGPGLVAAVITRAIEEASRMAVAAGGEDRTLLGLAGYGDLLASIAQSERPEVRLGEALARGIALDRALAELGQRVEAVDLFGRLVAWAESHGVAAPVFATLGRDLFSGQPTDALVRELMSDRP